jgi:hypothetical protein
VHAKFSLKKVSIKLFLSGAAENYENKKGVFETERSFKTLSQKKESHPIRGPLTIWRHNG